MLLEVYKNPSLLLPSGDSDNQLLEARKQLKQNKFAAGSSF
jgi:hypothetical protein